MEFNLLDNVSRSLTQLLVHREQYSAKYGPAAAEYLDHLPSLYRLHYRLTFDLGLSSTLRGRSEAIAVYLAEPHDYFGESTSGVEGLVDDVWLAFEGLRHLLDQVPEALLRRHWQSERPFDQAVDLARRVAALETSVPSRVLIQLKKFLN